VDSKTLKIEMLKKKEELEKQLAHLEKNILIVEEGWFPEVAIRKRDRELAVPTYLLNHADVIMVELTFPHISTTPYHQNPIKIDMDAFIRDYVEYSPKVRGYYPRGDS
jgi:hypothetical protein